MPVSAWFFLAAKPEFSPRRGPSPPTTRSAPSPPPPGPPEARHPASHAGVPSPGAGPASPQHPRSPRAQPAPLGVAPSPTRIPSQRPRLLAHGPRGYPAPRVTLRRRRPSPHPGCPLPGHTSPGTFPAASPRASTTPRARHSTLLMYSAGSNWHRNCPQARSSGLKSRVPLLRGVVFCYPPTTSRKTANGNFKGTWENLGPNSLVGGAHPKP